LKYVAKAFGVDMDNIVKWFTLAIVLVFDPLAVSLILAYNSLIEKKSKTIEFDGIKKEITKIKTPLPVDEKPTGFRKHLNNIINYRV
jgi:hypothetical protein